MVNTMRSSWPQHETIPSMKFKTPDRLTARDFSIKNWSRSSATMMERLVVCNKSIFKSESSATLDMSI
uniref:Uncharacterized protein n=1 Tax=Rhizophora mucronata TaxID=61149 RepID=A0A2P2P6Q9_RHIMU